MADVWSHLEQGTGGIGFLDVHVVGVRDDQHRGRSNFDNESGGSGECVDEVVLVAVEGFEKKFDTLALGLLAQPPERIHQDTAVALGRAMRLERGATEGYDAGGAGGHDSEAAEFGHDAQLRGELCDRILAKLRVEGSDEVRHLDAGRWHDDTGIARPTEFGEPGCKVEIAPAPELDAVEPPSEGNVEFLLQR